MAIKPAPVADPGASASTPSPSPKALRAGSKGAALLSLLQREEGASLDEMIERTGWQGNTVRAAMTGLRKKAISSTTCLWQQPRLVHRR